MSICSCVLHAEPGCGALIADKVATLQGVEVHGGVDEDRLILTLEDTPLSLAADTLASLDQIPGVLSTVLIFHYGGHDIEPEEHLPS